MIGVVKVTMWERRKIGERYGGVNERMNRRKWFEISFFFFFSFLSHQVYLSFSLHFGSLFFLTLLLIRLLSLSSPLSVVRILPLAISCSIFCLTAMCLFQDVSSFSQFPALPKFISCCYREPLNEQKEEGLPMKTRSNVPRKDAYAFNFAGDSTREITVTLTLERKDKARGVFPRIVFKRCVCTPTRLFITPAENCSRRASCYNLQRQTADNNDMITVSNA